MFNIPQTNSIHLDVARTLPGTTSQLSSEGLEGDFLM